MSLLETMQETMQEDEDKNNQILSVKIRDSEWRRTGFEETEAWESISNLCHGAVTYAPWSVKKKYQNCLDGKWLVAWNNEWIICRNYGWHSVTTKKWANMNKCGASFWSSGGSPGVCGDIEVTYGGDDYNFEVEDPISGTVYWVEWIVMRRD
jgi:hypothetical protein